MLGIRFVSYAPFCRILAIFLSQIRPDRPNWFVNECMTLSDDNPIETRLYSTDELLSMLKAIGSIAIDYACLFATTRKNIGMDDLPQTVTDYLESSFSAVVVCTDSVEYDFYCKDGNALNVVRSWLISSQICSIEEIKILTSESDDRTGFNW